MAERLGTKSACFALQLMLSLLAVQAVAQGPRYAPSDYAPPTDSVPQYPATAGPSYPPTYPTSYPTAGPQYPNTASNSVQPNYAAPPVAPYSAPYTAPESAAAPYQAAGPSVTNLDPASTGNPYAHLAPGNQTGAYVPPATPRVAQAPSIPGDTYPSPSDQIVVQPPAVAPVESPAEEVIIYEDTTWYNPSTWFAGPIWENSVEFGLNGSDGNSETLSIRVGASAKRETKQSTLNLEARYNKASASGIETQNNAIGEIRHDWLLGDSPWSLFANGMIEYDEFRAFDARVAVNSGVGYRIFNTPSTKLKGRFGSGVSHEIGGPNDDYVPEAVFGLDYDQKITKRQKIVAKADYFPEWGNFEDYRFITDVGWEILLDEEANLSMKIAMTDRYDSTPEGRKPNDITYSLLLLWKL